MLLLWLASVIVVVPVPMENDIYNRMLIFTPFVSASVIVVCYFVINFRMITRKTPTGGAQQSQNISILVYSISVTAIFMICTFPYTILAIQQEAHVLRMQFPDYSIYLFYLQTVLNPFAYFFFQVWKRGKFFPSCNVCQCCVSSNLS